MCEGCADMGAAAPCGHPHLGQQAEVPRVGRLREGFAGMDAATSSEWTRETLGWTPTGPTLAEDLEAGGYFS